MKRLKLVLLQLLSVSLIMMGLVVNVNAEPRQNEMFELIDKIIEAEIDYGLSGAQLVVMHKGEVVKQTAYGYTNSYKNVYDSNGNSILDEYEVIERNKRNKVTNDTLFDLASNTKMYAGNYAIQYLISNGELSLETKVKDIYPEYSYQGIGVDGQAELTIGHLLRHDSGFIASPKYHDNTFLGNLGNGDNPENWLYSQDPDTILEKLLLTPLEFMPGEKVRYSDVDFMLIGKIVEEVSGLTFDEFLDKNIYEPLNLKNITFNPLENGFDKLDTTSSELHGNTRDGRVFFNNYLSEVVTGVVHDEKAFYTFKGIAGHAGLFGSATDIASLASLMLEGGVRDNKTYFTQATIDEFSKGSPLNDTYAYGWRRQGANNGYGWAFSNYASENTLGHTGWTGTITQIDPENDLVIALFTNARNSPIMGPDKNDFYTKAFRTNDYGTINTLVYEALNLGSDIDAVDYLINLIDEELNNNKDTASNRNELRALYTVLKDYAKTDEKALNYVSENLEKDILSINDDLRAESKHLDLSHLATDKSELIRVIEENSDARYDDLKAYANLIVKDDTATQDVIDDLVSKLQVTEEVKVDLTNLNAIISKIDALDKTLYTSTSLKPLMDEYAKVQAYLANDNLQQNEVDAYTESLNALYNNLELIPVNVTEKEDVDTGLDDYTSLYASITLSAIFLLVLLRKRRTV